MGNRGSSCCATQSEPERNLDASYEMSQRAQTEAQGSDQELEEDADHLSSDEETHCKEPLQVGEARGSDQELEEDADHLSSDEETHCKEPLPVGDVSALDIDVQSSGDREEEDVEQSSPDKTTHSKEEFTLEGVRKYFFDIKENVSSDWKDLAFHLRFSRPDIDNIAGRNQDDKSRCMDLLEEWYKCNGNKATTEVLMNTLSKANLQSTVDGLRNKYPELNTPQAFSFARKSWQKRKKGKANSKKNVFQRCVKEYYRFKLTTLKPLIWVDNFTLNLNDIYTELVLMPTEKRNRECFWFTEEGTKLNYLDDVLSTDVTGLSKRPRCILIEGEAGGGKTTFLSKEALDAVSRISELGRKHDIVLLIRLREVREGETIEEMVWDQCVPETTEGVDLESIRAILQKNESRVLFLLDGYDELRPEAKVAKQTIPNLLSGKLYLNSTIVITSRPTAGVQQYTQPDCHVRIKGFSQDHVAKYVRQYFSAIGKPILAEELINQFFYVFRQSNKSARRRDSDINDEADDDDDDGDDVKTNLVPREDELLNSLMHTPIFLTLVCVVWEEEPEMVYMRTMTVMYDNLLTCLIRKYCRREGVDMPTDWQSEDFGHLVLQLGKLALEALLRNETLLNLTNVEREIVNWENLLKLGVVSLEVSASKLHPLKQLNFTHKTIQEFLAGRYIAHVFENHDTVELLQLTSTTKALEHSNLLRFACGCDARVTHAILYELGKVSQKELSHLQVNNFEESSHLPVWPEVKKSIQDYERFVFLCLNILNERKDELHAVSRVLPFIIVDTFAFFPQHFGLLYYLQNIQTRMVLNIRVLNLPSLERSFTSPVPGVQLEFEVRIAMFYSAEYMSRFTSVMKNFPSLRALKLSNTGITTSSFRPLVQGFRHMSLLEVLDLSSNNLRDDGLEILRGGLHFVPHLAVLRLGSVGMSADGISSLVPQMRHLRKLRELDISRNKVGDSGIESVTNILPILTAMQVLVLSNTAVTSRGMLSLVQTLCFLIRMIKLDISGNDIGDHGLEYIASILPRLKAMLVLDLSGIRISDKGMSALAKVLPHLLKLQVLNVSCNRMGDAGLECLAEILPHLKAMKVLNLGRIGFTDKGALALVKVLPYLVELQVLDLCHNRIGDSGIVPLVQTICQPRGFDLEQNPSGDKSLNPAHHCNITMQELNIGFNEGVTGAGLGRAVQAITTLPALTRLVMSSVSLDKPVRLTNTDAMALAEALSRLPTLRELQLMRVFMKRVGFREVMQAAKKHPNLENFTYSTDLVPKGADTSAKCLNLFDF